MLQIIVLLLTTLPYIHGQNAERMEADNRVYIGDFTQPPYSMGKADNSIAYPYHSNYLSFSLNNNNGYQPFNPNIAPMGKADNSIAYSYHNNYVSFPPSNNNGYQPFNLHSVPTTMPNHQTSTLGGYNGHSVYANYAPLNTWQGYNNFGMARTYGVGISSNANFVPVTYSTHQPIMDGRHTSIGAALGGSMNGMSAYPPNGHYNGYYPYKSLGILQSFK
ncbi:PREDICTED: uncharacterized protein LOC108966667 [Bactrocera latifrons]|uniref:Uncharacterized protein n=1 Tax=Bactrocera latifrons TaxID=174628 RepID=A0A0K8VUM6_BACLA|nr:PREDICTED: uncharacterized protein LOC108966667 [Bactrocera latifrons]